MNRFQNFKSFYLITVLLLFLFLYPFEQTFAQSMTVQGTVTDFTEDFPLPGVNIVEVGTSNGTVTDVDGKYSLNVSEPGAVLKFSYIGYEEQQIPLDGQQTLDLALKSSVKMLSEMVVIGYGVQRKEDLTGSVAVVDVGELNQTNPVSFDRALQGRAAGVHVTSTSGRPGGEVSVKVRGIGSISRSSEPLYVVDGMPLSSGGINAINPADIESIQVLKDASATAIYGTRGANGVIVVTTKRGDAGKPQVNYTFNFTTSQIPNTYDIMNADQYSEFMNSSWSAYSERLNIEEDKNLYLMVYSPEARQRHGNFHTDTDFQSELTRTGTGQNHNLSVGGGNDKSNYFISANYFEEDGTMINTAMDRISLRTNSDFILLDRIKIGHSASLSNINYVYDSHHTNFNSWLNTIISSPLMPLYDPSAKGGFGGPTDSLTGANERTNPIAEQLLNENTSKVNRIVTNAFAEVDLWEGLSYSFRIGGEYSNLFSRQWSPEYTLGNMKVRDMDVSNLLENSITQQIWQYGNYLEYKNDFGDHNLAAILGFERMKDYQYNVLSGGRNLPFEELNVLDQATSGERIGGSNETEKLQSHLVRVLYDYKGRYLVTASIRRDGSSKFAPANRIGYFPSFSAGWRLSDDLFQNAEMIDMMKLRFGWGQTGNSNIPRYQYLELIDPYIHSRYNFGLNQDVFLGAAPLSFQSSPQIQWEATEMTNFGFDMNALDGKIQFTAEYYIKNQNNMLVSKPISVIFGKKKQYGTEQPTVGAWMNLARVQNRGVELNLIYQNFDHALNYSVSGNFSTLKNEIIDLGVGEFATDLTISRNGHTIGSFFGYIAERILQEEDFMQDEDGNLITDGQNNYTILHAFQENGTSPGDIKYKDLNGDGLINDLDRTIIGKPLPDFIYGLDVQLDYRNWDLGIFLNGMQNMDVYNQLFSRAGIATDRFSKDENKIVDVLNHWTPENRSNTMTRAYALDPNQNDRPSTWFLEDASFLRIRNIQLGFTLPQTLVNRAGVQSLRLYVSANNVYTFTKYRGYDPEIGSQDPLYAGVDGGHYPVPRTFMFGLMMDI